ncbi:MULTISPECIES: helix-turn-helix domain-containing protein [unclassified Meridianimarinicoccus]|uniref:helix-turn-helix domain-containing protein n=1 Tax=unclassified Meridianimarinicoccus TaxID=2923344 RepID=UPI0018692059|nr:helix-turn-helix domain-containing protein [Fluviibacterium sp. MJW13]
MPQADSKPDKDGTRARPEKDLESAIGREVRAHRHQLDMTVADLSRKTGLSMGMLSKIENGNISPSLTTLQSLATALNVPITTFFKRYERRRKAVHVRPSDAAEITRTGAPDSYRYSLLGDLGPSDTGISVEPYLITLTDNSDIHTGFQHDGVELIYVLEGEIRYRHGNDIYDLQPGDSFFFDADAPHGPEELIRVPVRVLSVISTPKAT